MRIFKSKSEYLNWRNGDDAYCKGHHSIEDEVTFDYWISSAKQLFDDSELTDIEKGRYEVKVYVAFAYTIFESIDISRCDFLWNFGLFNNCEFNGRLYFEGNIFKREFNISDAHFNNRNTVPAIFENCHFIAEAKFDGINSDREIIIRNCTFNEEVDFSNCILNNNISIKYCSFKKGIKFKDTKFNSKLYFLDNEVSCTLDFSNCEFNNTAKIVDTIGDFNEVLFSLATVKGMLQFNGWNDKMYLAPNTIIDFTHAFIEPTGYVIIRNVNDDESELTGFFNYSCANILGHIVMTDVYAGKLDLSCSSIIGSFNTENICFKIESNSQTFVRLKNEAHKRNDSIRAMRFKAKEMKSYKKELYNISKEYINMVLQYYSLDVLKIIFSLLIVVPLYLVSFFIGIYLYLILGSIFALLFIWTPIGKWLKKIYYYVQPLFMVIRALPVTEHVLLWLNTISNKNGQSWWRGFKFTIAVAFLFFVAINFCGIEQGNFFEWGWKDWSSFGEVWKNYLNMFYLTDFKDKFYGIRLNAFGETLFFVSKIFIGYGIYQTISAFRKYGK